MADNMKYLAGKNDAMLPGWLTTGTESNMGVRLNEQESPEF